MTRIVALVWLATTVVALSYTWLRGRSLPFTDDWDAIVPVLVGKQRLSFEWIWSQQNEHRLPVLRVAQWLGVTLAGGDFRGPTLIGVALVSFGATVMLSVLRRWRGHNALADVCVPLALLRLGNSSFGWSGQVHFVCSTVLAIGVLRWGASPALLLLPLCGANGLVLALPLAIVLGIDAIRCRARNEPWRVRLAFVIATLALIGMYFIGWHSTPHEWAPPTTTSTFVMTAHYLGAAVNPAFDPLWPGDALLALAWIVAVAICLVHAWRTERSAFLPSLALFIALQLLLALVLGRARGGRGWLPDLGYNYASLELGFLAGLVAATLIVVPRKLLGLAQTALFALVAIPYVITTVLAFRSPEVAAVVASERALMDELAAGVAPARVADEYDALLLPRHHSETRKQVEAGLALLVAKRSRR